MPAFLSYSREDPEQAERISRQLADAGVTVWRDQEQLYGGQRWPKVLGEAIAASDALVLLWSRRAAKSAFVELEWCTALALRKQVIPCLLDDTPLPPSLAAIEAVPPARIATAVAGISGAPADETKSSDKSHVQEVVRQLGEIDGGEPAEVLRKAKAAFTQNKWSVQGSVYQAAGNIYVGTAPPRKSGLDRWQAWVAIVVGILTAVSLGIALVRNYIPATKPVATNVQPLAGLISDDGGEPLADVHVSVLLDGKVVASSATDSLGHFGLKVEGAAEAQVTLMAQKAGYETEERYKLLGDLGCNFGMRRKQP